MTALITKMSIHETWLAGGAPGTACVGRELDLDAEVHRVKRPTMSAGATGGAGHRKCGAASRQRLPRKTTSKASRR